MVLLFLQEKYPRPLTIDPENPVRYPTVLLAPNKLYNVGKTTQEQKSHQEVNPLNRLIDLVFSTQELAKASIEKKVPTCEDKSFFCELCWSGLEKGLTQTHKPDSSALQVNTWLDAQSCYWSAPESEPHVLPQFVPQSVSRNSYWINEAFPKYRAFPWTEFSDYYFQIFLTLCWSLVSFSSFISHLYAAWICGMFLNSLFNPHLSFLSLFSHSCFLAH